MIRWAFLHWIEVLFILAALIFLTTQILIPAWRGQRMFPTFKRQGKLESKLAGAVQKKEEEKIEKEIAAIESPPPKVDPTKKRTAFSKKRGTK